MSTAKIEVIEDGALELSPSPDQLTAWSRAAAAANKSVADWLGEVADASSTSLSYDERSWPHVIKLDEPIDLGKGKVITEIEMRRGKLADIKGIKLGGELPTEQLMLVASRLSGQSIAVIERLDAVDAGEVMSISLDFYSRCLTTTRRR